MVCDQLQRKGYIFDNRYVLILDADHIVIRDIEEELDKILGIHRPSILLAWNSGFYNRKTYLTKLSGSEFRLIDNKNLQYIHGKPYICMKAGFFAFIPFNSQSQLFLRMISDYALGGPGILKMRMFNFYYGDQLALHFATDDLNKYISRNLIDKIIFFIDLFTSKICNLNLKENPCIYMPKGNTAVKVLDEYKSLS